MMQSCRLIASLHTKQVQACWKNDAIEPNYCIIIVKRFQTFLIIMQSKKKILQHNFWQFWTCTKNYAIIASLFSNCFKHVTNMMWPGLGWASLGYWKNDAIKQNHCIIISNSFEHFQNMMQSKQIIASLIAFKRSFSLSKDVAIKANYCITISNSFEHI